MTRTDTLPEKLSDLIRVAITDMEKIDSKPHLYRVDMGEWHKREDHGICKVCFAGAVMAETLHTPHHRTVNFHHFPHPLKMKFGALDQIKDGDVEMSLWYMSRAKDPQSDRIADHEAKAAKRIEQMLNYELLSWHDDKDSFLSQMRLVADCLADEGL